MRMAMLPLSHSEDGKELVLALTRPGHARPGSLWAAPEANYPPTTARCPVVPQHPCAPGHGHEQSQPLSPGAEESKMRAKCHAEPWGSCSSPRHRTLLT